MSVDDAVTVRIEHPDDSLPVLRGSAAGLTEALSTRLPLPADAPQAWHRLLSGLAYTWDLVDDPSRGPGLR